MNKLVSGLVKGAIIATVGFFTGVVVAEKKDREEEKYVKEGK